MQKLLFLIITPLTFINVTHAMDAQNLSVKTSEPHNWGTITISTSNDCITACARKKNGSFLLATIVTKNTYDDFTMTAYTCNESALGKGARILKAKPNPEIVAFLKRKISEFEDKETSTHNFL